MANLICPPSPGNGAGTFSDKLVGYQITDGTAQFTMGNFTVTNSTASKQNREFEIELQLRKRIDELQQDLIDNLSNKRSD